MSDLRAIVWDFDGTLVDTRRKNLNVTRTLYEWTHGRPPTECEALRSLADYERALHRHRHWKEFYRQELGMSPDQVDDCERRWLERQLADETAAESYGGIPEVLEALARFPHGIVSLNARDNILRFLRQLDLERHFDEVIGFEAVERERQKPHPEALVLCIERLTDLTPGRVVYVGDHEADMECVHNTNAALAQRGLEVEVLGVSAQYAPHADDSGWVSEAHFRAEDPRAILGFVDELV